MLVAQTTPSQVATIIANWHESPGLLVRQGISGARMLPCGVFVNAEGATEYLYTVTGMINALQYLVNHAELAPAALARYVEVIGYKSLSFIQAVPT